MNIEEIGDFSFTSRHSLSDIQLSSLLSNLFVKTTTYERLFTYTTIMATAPQIRNRIEKLKKEIDNARYFITHASCKETKEMYQQALLEKQEELKLLLIQQVSGRPEHK